MIGLHAALIATAFVGLGAGAPESAAEATLKLEKYRLPNGLTVILSEDHRLPQVAVNVWYHVGAANQEPGKSGFAHLFEHMMFSGAKHLPKPPIALLESYGVPDTNGTTNFDRTNYFETVPAAQLPLALWVESERMGFLLDTLDQKKLEIQRDVVSNERRMRYENRPYGIAQLRLCDELFPKPHPYFNCVIGEVQEIQSASVEDVKAFFRRFYAPSNASIAIVGDFDPTAAKALVAKYFATLPTAPEVAPPAPRPPPARVPPPSTIVDPHAAVPQITFAWYGTRGYADDDIAGDMLSMILASGRASRLYRALVQGSEIASSVDAGNASLRLGGYFEVTTTANQGHSPDELRTATLAVVRALRDEGPKPEEVERARRQLLAGRLRQLERIGGKADLLNELEMYVGDPGHLPNHLDAIRRVTAQDIQAFAKRYLVEDRRIELTVVPAPKAPQASETTR